MTTLTKLKVSITHLVEHWAHPLDPVRRFYDNPHFTVRLYLVRHPHRKRLTEAVGLNSA
jgi:hypothetical protein